MEFRRRHNMFHATLEAFASMDTVGAVTEEGIEHTRWLGVADRQILRLVPELKVGAAGRSSVANHDSGALQSAWPWQLYGRGSNW